MSAHGFIAEIFSRSQSNMAGNVRAITQRQYAKLLELIAEDPEGGAVRTELGGLTIWTPSGRWKYVLRADPLTGHHSLMKLASPQPSASGSLFGP